MGDEYDGSLSLGRQLSEEETYELRISLLPYFHVEGGMESDDISDFLDYAFTMISNDKTIEYIVTECGGFFSPEVSKKIGKELAVRIKALKGWGEETAQEKTAENESKEGTQRKVRIHRFVGDSVCLTASPNISSAEISA